MKSWAVRLAGALDILLGLVVVALNLPPVWGEADETGRNAAAAWAVVGGVMALTGVGVVLRKGWGRAVGILIALVYLAVCAAFVATRGLNFDGGREALRLMLVVSTGLSQAFVVLVLAFGWRAAKAGGGER